MYAHMIFHKDAEAVQWRKDTLFNKWCWSNWTSRGKNQTKPNKQTKTLDLNDTPYPKMNSKWIMVILGKNRRKSLQDLGLSKKLLDLTPEAQSIRGKIDTLNLLKNLKICSQKTLLRRQKDKVQTGRKYLQMNQQTKDWSPKYINSSCSSILKRQTTQLKKGWKT